MRALYEAPTPIGIASIDGTFVYVNRAVSKLTGNSETELLGMRWQDLTHPDDLEDDLDAIREILAGESESYERDKRVIRADGRLIWVRLRVSVVRDADGMPLQFVSGVEDVTEEKLLAESLQYMATHDSLTGLWSRARLIDELSLDLRRARRDLRTGALAILDLDSFKEINDPAATTSRTGKRPRRDLPHGASAGCGRRGT